MGELVAGALLGAAVSKLLEAIIYAIKKTLYFKSELKEMQETINIIRPIVKDIEKLNEELGGREEETDRFIDLLKQAEDLVRKCEKITWNKPSYAKKLDKMNKRLLKFMQIDLQLQIARNGMEVLVDSRKGSEKGSSSGVPLEKCIAIGFDDRVKVLKAMVLEDDPDGDCSVVVVSAAGGYGKTTLVKMLCHDPDIQSVFGKNIHYVTVSRTYNLKVVIKQLLGKLPDDINDEAAIQQWGRYLGENESKILLVLDDVWSESIITDLKFKSLRYKILVTSRTAFEQLKPYRLEGLNNQDATRLFRYSAFPKHQNEHNIPDELVKKLVECCKNHPLALSVIGGSLNGKRLASWELMLKKQSKGNKSFSKFHKPIQDCLEKSFHLFDEPEIKQCYLDLGLFPEDQKIAATALMDMWAHLYDHDEEGLDTIDILSTLSCRNLATLLPKRKHAIDNRCEDEYVMQHDMMRELAIHLSNEEEVIENRERLIVNTYGQDLLQSTHIVNARILSISTEDKKFPLTWDKVQVPKVEVFVLNFMSKMHPLPEFVMNMVSLKVLIITNYGYYFSEIQNFPAPQYLSGLTTIRLDHASISSISTTILMLENLQKLSLIMCKLGNSFNEGTPNKLTSLLEIDIESCDDLLTFPAVLCNSVKLKKLSITNCHELTSLSEEFGNLTNLEVLRFASCSKLTVIPESVSNLKSLRIIDLSHCLNLCKLPMHIGELTGLKKIVVTACTGLHELPESVNDFVKIKVVCDDEISHRWKELKNVELEEVQEDTRDTFSMISGIHI